MNKFLRSFFNVLFAPLIWLIQACSPLGKPVDMEISDNFYYSKDGSDIIYSSMGNWFELGKSPLNAHAESFQVLNKHIGKDKDNAYYREHPILDPDLDLETFQASREEWMWHIGMDKYRVYSFAHDVIDGKWQLITKIVENADPSTFKQYDYYWSKDSAHHFYDFQLIPVNYASFEIINETFAKDTNSIFLHYQGRFEKIEGDSRSFEKIEKNYARDESKIFLFLSYLRGEKIESMRFIPYTDAATIKVLEQYYLLVDDLVYYQGMQLPNAKASTIQVLDELYAKDEQHVYYMNQIIEGADAATFSFEKNYVIYKDKNHRYRDGKIWNGKNQTIGTGE